MLYILCLRAGTRWLVRDEHQSIKLKTDETSGEKKKRKKKEEEEIRNLLSINKFINSLI